MLSGLPTSTEHVSKIRHFVDWVPLIQEALPRELSGLRTSTVRSTTARSFNARCFMCEGNKLLKLFAPYCRPLTGRWLPDGVSASIAEGFLAASRPHV